MRTLIKISLVLVTVLFTSRSFADHADDGFYVWADVVDVDPIVTTHYEQVPVTHCRVEKRHPVHAGWSGDSDRHRRGDRHDDHDYHYRDRAHHGNGDSVMPTLLGGLIGGAIGNRFGDGDGRRAMTILGAFAGASIANTSSRNHRADRDRHDDRRVEKMRGNKYRVCETGYELESTEVIEGYQVTWRYLGREFTERTDHHPGEKMKVYVTVAPVERTGRKERTV